MEQKDTKRKIVRWIKLVAIACVLSLVLLAVIMYTVMEETKREAGPELNKKAEKTISKKSKIVDGKIGPNLPDDIEHEPPTGILVDIMNEDIFETGYYAYHFDIFSSAVAYINSDNDAESDTEWKIYVSDKELTEAEIYALEDTEPAIVNTGEVNIYSDQWIYILCNINSKTATAPSGSHINITCMRDYA